MRQSTSHIDPHRRLSDGPGEPLDVASGVFGHGRPADLAGITEAIDNVACPGWYPRADAQRPNRRCSMKFQDIFVPRWQHSNPDVRIKAVNRMKDKSLLMQIVEKDDDEMVIMAARDRLAELGEEKIRVEA
jgi:hypothetical protein